MAGSREGGKKAAISMKKRFGEDFYKELGKKGGKTPKSTPSGFAADRQRAVKAGRLGGLNRWQGRRDSDNY